MFSSKMLKGLVLTTILFTITNCCTTQNDLKEEEISMAKKNNNNIISPAPGTAEVKCIVTDIFEKENKLFCSIKVKSVEKYGSSTKPISANSEMELEFKESHKEKLDSAKSNKEELLITIVSKPGGMGQENDTNWRIIKIFE